MTRQAGHRLCSVVCFMFACFAVCHKAQISHDFVRIWYISRINALPPRYVAYLREIGVVYYCWWVSCVGGCVYSRLAVLPCPLSLCKPLSLPGRMPSYLPTFFRLSVVFKQVENFSTCDHFDQKLNRLLVYRKWVSQYPRVAVSLPSGKNDTSDRGYCCERAQRSLLFLIFFSKKTTTTVWAFLPL